MPQNELSVSAGWGELGKILQSPAPAPGSPDALHWEGLQALGRGQAGEAAVLLEQAVAAKPLDGIFHLNLGNAYLMRKQADKALACFERALILEPASAEARYNLGLACLLLERWQDAQCAFREALRFRGNYPQAIHALGYACEQLGRKTEAAACYREVLRQVPDHRESLLRLGALLLSQGDLNSAEAVFHRLLAADPACVEAWSNLSSVLLRQGRGAEAESSASEALRLKPDFVPARVNHAISLWLQGGLARALATYEQTLPLAPQDAKLRWNHALALLASGRWPEGWKEYEWRFAAGITEPRAYPQPVWDGASSVRVLVWAEQGLGDTIQFLRYVSLVRERASSVIVEVQPRLLPLLQESPFLAGVDVRGQGDFLPAFDAHIPMLSLPARFGTTPSTIPWPGPYFPAPNREPAPRLAVGLCWSGNSAHPQDRIRSLAPSLLSPLTTAGGAEFFSLQRDASELPPRTQPLERLGNTLADTAALIAGLDLVISADTMVAHLAGAMGKPVWLLLASMADWRWLAEGGSTAWYPHTRLFRQQPGEDWAAVINRVREALIEAGRPAHSAGTGPRPRDAASPSG